MNKEHTMSSDLCRKLGSQDLRYMQVSDDFQIVRLDQEEGPGCLHVVPERGSKEADAIGQTATIRAFLPLVIRGFRVKSCHSTALSVSET